MNKGDGTINLEGLAINNGCWGNQVGTCGFANDEVRVELDYQFGHSLISQRLYKTLQTACDWPIPVRSQQSNKSTIALYLLRMIAMLVNTDAEGLAAE